MFYNARKVATARHARGTAAAVQRTKTNPLYFLLVEQSPINSTNNNNERKNLGCSSPRQIE